MTNIKKLTFQQALEQSIDKDQKYIQLMHLLDQTIYQYNGSHCVSKELSQSLLNSIIYTIDYYMSFHNVSLQNSSIQNLYKSSYDFLKQQLSFLYMRVQKIQTYIYNLDVYVYKHTIIDGFNAFFEHYNYRYFANDDIITYDYPLNTKSEGDGIIKLTNYLQNLYYEELFLKSFSEKEINDILHRCPYYHPDMIENISRIVLQQVLYNSLDIFKCDTLENAKKHLMYLYNTLYSQQPFYDYFKQTIDDLAFSFYFHIHNDTLYQFISKKE